MKFIVQLVLILVLALNIPSLALSQEQKPVEIKPSEPPVKVPALKLPDLVVRRIMCAPGNKLQFEVANVGGPLPPGWVGKSHVWINGKTVFDSIDLSKAVATTAGGIERTGGASLYETPHRIAVPITVKVETDYGNYIKESNEKNNITSAKIVPCEPPQTPDLVVRMRAPSVVYRTPESGAVVHIDLTVRNVGSAKARTSYVEVTIDPCPPGRAARHRSSVPELEPGESFDSSLTVGGMPVGDYTFCAVADATHLVRESDEGNNKICQELHVVER